TSAERARRTDPDLNRLAAVSRSAYGEQPALLPALPAAEPVLRNRESVRAAAPVVSVRSGQFLRNGGPERAALHANTPGAMCVARGESRGLVGRDRLRGLRLHDRLRQVVHYLGVGASFGQVGRPHQLFLPPLQSVGDLLLDARRVQVTLAGGFL